MNQKIVMKNLSRSAVLVLATCFICNISFAQSYSTSFTSGEGFSDGSLSGNANWSEYGAGDSLFTVQDATGEGNVQVGSGFAGVANSSTVYDWTVTTGKFTQSTEFQFTDIAGSVSATTLYRQYFSKDSDGTGAEDRTYLEIRKNGTTFQLAAFGTSVYSFSESDLGLSGSDPDSDVIRITSQFEAGATSSDWIGTYTIYNVTTDATLVSDSITLSSLGFTLIGDSSVHGAMNVDNETGAVSSLEVLSFSTSYVIPEPSAFAMLTGVFALACVAVRRRRG